MVKINQNIIVVERMRNDDGFLPESAEDRKSYYDKLMNTKFQFE